VDALYITHIQVNQAQKQRRRTYRAHGRINRKLVLIRFVLVNLTSTFPSVFTGIFFFLSSLHVQPLPHWVDFIWKGRAS
jgi:hypothetical protein